MSPQLAQVIPIVTLKFLTTLPQFPQIFTFSEYPPNHRLVAPRKIAEFFWIVFPSMSLQLPQVIPIVTLKFLTTLPQFPQIFTFSKYSPNYRLVAPRKIAKSPNSYQLFFHRCLQLLQVIPKITLKFLTTLPQFPQILSQIFTFSEYPPNYRLLAPGKITLALGSVRSENISVLCAYVFKKFRENLKNTIASSFMSRKFDGEDITICRTEVPGLFAETQVQGTPMKWKSL